MLDKRNPQRRTSESGVRRAAGNRIVADRRALTLVELVLVLTLTLILSAAAIGGLRGVQTWRAAAAVRRIQADLQYARSLAMLSTRRTLCVFEPGNVSYQLQQEPSPASGNIAGQTIIHPVTDQPWQVVLSDLASNLTVSISPAQNPASFGFDTSGALVNAAGSVLAGDVVMSFNTGATIRLHAGSGLCEVTWP